MTTPTGVLPPGRPEAVVGRAAIAEHIYKCASRNFEVSPGSVQVETPASDSPDPETL